MCMTTESELPRKVVQLARRHELDEHVKPEPTHSLTVREALLWVGGSIAFMALILLIAASHT